MDDLWDGLIYIFVEFVMDPLLGLLGDGLTNGQTKRRMILLLIGLFALVITAVLLIGRYLRR